MIDYHLKFDSKADANAVLYTGEQQNFANIDVIGTIYKPTGKMLKGTEGEYPEMAALPGYHVNVRVMGEDASALEPYKVEPKNPIRAWA